MPSVNAHQIYKICQRCGGTGKLYTAPGGATSEVAVVNEPPTGWTEIACPTCNGLTLVMWGWMKDDIDVFTY